MQTISSWQTRSWFMRRARSTPEIGLTHSRCRLRGALCWQALRAGGQQNANADEQETQEQEQEQEQELERELELDLEREREQEREQERERERELERERERELEQVVMNNPMALEDKGEEVE